MSVCRKIRSSNLARTYCTAIAALLGCSMLSGCLVAGYGTNSSDVMLPGGLGLIFVLGLLLWFLLRKR